MKTAAKYQNPSKVISFRKRPTPAYPNAAGSRYHLGKALDYLLTVASTAGVIAALMFLFVYF